jgi:hypothetical protein
MPLCGNLYQGNTLRALAGDVTLRREAASFLRVGLGKPATRFGETERTPCSRLLVRRSDGLAVASSSLPASGKPEPPCKSGQLKKDLGLEVSSARHAARLIMFEVMKFLFVG